MTTWKRRILLALIAGFSVGATAVNCLATDGSSSGPAPDVAFELVHAFVAEGTTPRSPLVPDGQGSLYGTTYYGGLYSASYGNIFKLDTAGRMTIVHSFQGDDGRNPTSLIRRPDDGSLWGTTNWGGGPSTVSGQNQGTVFRIDPDGTFSVIYKFDPFVAATWGVGQPISLVFGPQQPGPPPLYGATVNAIFRIDANGVIVRRLDDIIPSPVANPGLILAADGFFYGTARGGATGCGTIFRFDTNLTAEVIYAFGSDSGGACGAAQGTDAGLVEDAGGWLYGVTRTAIFRISGAGVVEIVHEFGPDEGDDARAGLVRGPDGALYGTTTSGGPYGGGSVFKIDPATAAVTVLHGFPACCFSPDGNFVVAALVWDEAGGVFYGAASDGGINRNGMLFKVAPAGAYEKVHSFGTEPSQPQAPLLQATDGRLYSTTFGGGAYQRGTVFRLETNREVSLLLSPGNRPSGAGSLIQGQDGKFYGALGSATGGPFEDRWGGVWLFEMDDTGTVLNSQASGLAPNPNQIPTFNTLMQAADGAFYATSSASVYAASAYGTVIKLDNRFNFVYVPLHAFDPLADGAYPIAPLVQGSDGYLYGTNSGANVQYGWFGLSANQHGTVFRMDPGTGQATLLHSFDGTHGSYPQAPVLEANGALYGSTVAGGACGLGTIFRISDGAFSVLHDFCGGPTDGAQPYAGLLLAGDGNFYGTTMAGGAAGDGTVFRMDSSGEVTVLHSFNRFIDGAAPVAGLLQTSDGSIYGTNSQGGPRGDGGTIFRLVLSTPPPPTPAITSSPTNPTNQTTATFAFTDTEAGVTFVCQLDAGSLAGCISPVTYSGLTAGSHTFSVMAQNTAGKQSGAATFTWSIAASLPQPPTITAAPSDPTNQTSATFAFTAAESGVSFVCQRDASTYAPCTSPTSYVGLGAGPHTFSVRTVDAVNNQSAATSHSWTIDLTSPPPPVMTAAPLNPTNQTTATFGFTDAEAGVSYACKLDAGSTTVCTSPITYSALIAGSHTFSVVAQDAAGNQSGATTFTWTIDTTPPQKPTITSAPSDPTIQTTAMFTFTAPETGVSFVCQRDGGASITCTSPMTYPSLAAGAHTFSVRAVDAAGNQSAATTYGWTIDLTPPAAPTIMSSPPNPTNQTTAAFTFSGEKDASFRCQLDGGAVAICAGTMTYPGLSAGSHTFAVKAQDLAGNQSVAATFTWTIDLTPPAAPSITTPPANPTNQTTASFGFTAEVGAAFKCQLDGGSFGACTSPKTYTNLKEGGHTFAVRAQDVAGNQSVSSYTWTIDTTAPPAPAITSAPPAASSSTAATFTFTDAEAGVTLLCQLDGAAFGTCMSPKTYSSLSQGTHTFTVRAQDLAGNQSTVASATWVVDTTVLPPTITSAPASGTKQTKATFRFSGETGATFSCQLDGSAFTGCSGSQGLSETYSNLGVGTHLFAVRQRDAAGNQSTATTYSWTIVP